MRSSLQRLCESAPPLCLQPDVRCDKIKRTPIGFSLLLRNTRSVCPSFALISAFSLSHTYMFSFPLSWHKPGAGMCWVTWQGSRGTNPTLQHLPSHPPLTLYYPTYLWAQQIIVRIKHRCVKQQVLWHTTTANDATAATARCYKNIRWRQKEILTTFSAEENQQNHDGNPFTPNISSESIQPRVRSDANNM